MATSHRVHKEKDMSDEETSENGGLLSDHGAFEDEDSPPSYKKRLELLATKPNRTVFWVQTVLIIILTISLITSLFFNAFFFPARCVKSISSPSLLRDDAGLEPFQTTFFNGSVKHYTKWRGYPNPELDAAWDSIIHVKLIALEDSEVRRLGKDPSRIVRVPSEYKEEYGDGALVSTEIGHQLHCLNLIRQFTYADYYRDHLIDFVQNPDERLLRGHVNHCIDMIRQALMCNADTGLVTHEWRKGRPRMLPDFSVQHKCRDFDAIMDWAKAHEIKGMIPPVVPEPGEAVLPWN